MSDEDIEEGPKDWSFTSHVGADLRGIDLSGANLRRRSLMERTWKVPICQALISVRLHSSVQI